MQGISVSNAQKLPWLMANVFRVLAGNGIAFLVRNDLAQKAVGQCFFLRPGLETVATVFIRLCSHSTKTRWRTMSGVVAFKADGDDGIGNGLARFLLHHHTGNFLGDHLLGNVA